MTDVAQTGDKMGMAPLGRDSRGALSRLMAFSLSLAALVYPLAADAQSRGEAAADRQFGVTGEFGVRLVENARAAALLGVELRAYDETRWSRSGDGMTIAERHTFAPIGASMTIGEGGEVADYQLRTLPVGWLSVETVNSRQVSTMKGFVEATIGRELALDRQLTVDIALIRSMLDLREAQTHITIDARLLGWRHVRFASDDGTYNGARLFQLGARLGQRVGGSDTVWLEPFLSLAADTSLGAQRERRFTTDVLVEAAAGLHVALGQYVAWESAAAYRGARNRIRPTNPGSWRMDSSISVTY